MDIDVTNPFLLSPLDARAGRVEAGGAAMAGNAQTGNTVTDGLSRTHRMTLDEAKLILNLKNATEAEKEDLIRVSYALT